MKRLKIEHDFSKFHIILRTRIDFIQELLEIPELLWNKGLGIILTIMIITNFQLWQIILLAIWIIISINFTVKEENKNE